MAAANPWDQRPDESSRAYELFAVYLNAGPTRSIAATARLTGNSDSNLRRYSTRFHWRDRAAALDRESLGRLVERRSEEREAQEMNELRLFAEVSMRRADRLGDASDKLLKLATLSMQRMLDDGEDLDSRLLASTLNAAASLAAMACDVKAKALGVDDLLVLLREDLEQEDS